MNPDTQLDSTADGLLAAEARKPYQKPELVAHGSVGLLTQTGGTNQHPDGVFTHKLS